MTFVGAGRVVGGEEAIRGAEALGRASFIAGAEGARASTKISRRVPARVDSNANPSTVSREIGVLIELPLRGEEWRCGLCRCAMDLAKIERPSPVGS